MAMTQVQVLHDVLQSGIRLCVTLYDSPDLGSLVRFEKSGKGGRLCIRNRPSGIGWLGGFLLTRERVAGIEVVWLFWTAPSLTSEAGHRP